MDGVVRLGATCGADCHGDAVTAFTHEDMTYDNADTEGTYHICSLWARNPIVVKLDATVEGYLS